MTRLRRIYYSQATYHVTIRGNNRHSVFEREENKILFLETLAKFKQRFGFKLFGFVLMRNHPHLVICVGDKHTISKIMQAVLLSFGNKYRRRNNYFGHVWQGRFNSKPIESERYIIKCLEYIHANPVRAGVVSLESDYLWSSYHFYHSESDPMRKYITLDRIEGTLPS